MSDFPFLFLLKRFKGTDPVEEVTEQVKAAKIEDKPKEVKTEAVDEVLAGLLTRMFASWFESSCLLPRVHPSTPSRC